MFIVIYRPHNELNLDTQYIGPFASEAEAYDYLCDCLPALGPHVVEENDVVQNPGVKFVQPMQEPKWIGIHG